MHLARQSRGYAIIVLHCSSNDSSVAFLGGRGILASIPKLVASTREIERDAAGGILDDRDAAADLRDRLKRELDAKEQPHEQHT